MSFGRARQATIRVEGPMCSDSDDEDNQTNNTDGTQVFVPWTATKPNTTKTLISEIEKQEQEDQETDSDTDEQDETGYTGADMGYYYSRPTYNTYNYRDNDYEGERRSRGFRNEFYVDEDQEQPRMTVGGSRFSQPRGQDYVRNPEPMPVIRLGVQKAPAATTTFRVTETTEESKPSATRYVPPRQRAAAPPPPQPRQGGWFGTRSQVPSRQNQEAQEVETWKLNT